MEYIAFGDVLFEEHSSLFSSPYLFNGKELDRETNISYYGARYLDMKTSLWLSVDPLALYNPIFEDEFYFDGQHNGGVYNSGNLALYTYCYQNPVRFIDPNGKQVDVVDFIPFIGSGRDIYRGIRDGDGVALTIGVVGLALDVATLGSGSLVKGAAKTGGKVLLEGGSKYIVIGGAKKGAEEIANNGLKYGKTAYAYRKNLEVFSGILGKGFDAHHVFPKAEKFAEFFTKAGIDVNNPANMKWLEATIHRGKNSAAHLKEWSNVMERFKKSGIVPTKELLQKEAKRIEQIFEK